MAVTAETTVADVKTFIHANWQVPIALQNLSFERQDNSTGLMGSDVFTFHAYGLTEATLKFIRMSVKQPPVLGNQKAQQRVLLL